MRASDSCAGLLSKAEQFLSERDLQAALHAFECAEGCGADASRCAAARWTVHALRGDYQAAWAESASIRARRLDGPSCFWRGEDIAARRVIVRCLHGFGDAVQFLRYAPLLNAIAERVTWEVPPAFVEIARCFRGADHITTWGSKRPATSSWDVQAEIMELPYIFQTKIAELPFATNYLRIPRRRVLCAAQMGVKVAPRVGIVWAAGEWNPSRSIPLHCFRSVLGTDGCEFWNLQGGAARDEWHVPPKRATPRDAQSCSGGILSLAAVISQLDLVVTVDTLAAHLAGALGIPAWVLLQYAADWRWMTERSDSPWYPSLRLFRQPAPGDWDSALRDVEANLCEWLESGAERLAA